MSKTNHKAMDFPDTVPAESHRGRYEKKSQNFDNYSESRSRSGKLVNDGHRFEYRVEHYAEGALGTLFGGGSKFKSEKVASMINAQAIAGFRMVFQIKEQRRMMIFWNRESIIMTFERAIS